MRPTRTSVLIKSFIRGVCCVATLLLCPMVSGQSNERPRNRTGEAQNPTVGLSDLAKDNLSRVAASSVQIRTVLVKDAGLLVEFKRWIAKEASDNGQVVEDSTLSDQAIFDRLDRDISLSRVATERDSRRPAPHSSRLAGKNLEPEGSANLLRAVSLCEMPGGSEARSSCRSGLLRSRDWRGACAVKCPGTASPETISGFAQERALRSPMGARTACFLSQFLRSLCLVEDCRLQYAPTLDLETGRFFPRAV